MSFKIVSTALVAATVGFFAASTVGTTQAAPLPVDTPLPGKTPPKPLPKPTSTTKNLSGRVFGIQVDAKGEILSFGVQTGTEGWGVKGCGARSADHPLLIAANGDAQHFAKINVVDGCLAQYTVWDAG